MTLLERGSDVEAKEFERTSTKVERDVNEFVKSNGIKEYEVVGYQVNWAEILR